MLLAYKLSCHGRIHIRLRLKIGHLPESTSKLPTCWKHGLVVEESSGDNPNCLWDMDIYYFIYIYTYVYAQPPPSRPPPTHNIPTRQVSECPEYVCKVQLLEDRDSINIDFVVACQEHSIYRDGWKMEADAGYTLVLILIYQKYTYIYI